MTPASLPPYTAPGRHRLMCRGCDIAWSSHTLHDLCPDCGASVGLANHDDLFKPVISRQPRPADGLMRWGGQTG